MSQEIKIRIYREGDEVGIVEILKRCFPVWANQKNPIEYWRWKFLDTPLKSIIVIAEDNNKIVGVGHRITFNLKIGENVIPCQIGPDFCTHPEYRGKGIHTRILELIQKLRVESNIKFMYSTSGNKIILNIWDKKRRGDTRFPFEVPVMVRINDLETHFKNRAQKNSTVLKLGFFSFNIINRIRNFFYFKTKINNDFTIKEITKFNDDLDIFWEKVKNDYKFILELNSTHLNWRYCDDRSGKYLIKQAMIGKDVLGFIVLEITDVNNYKEGYIMELLALKGRLDVVDSLLLDACKYFNQLDINTIYYETVENHPYQRLAIKNGFINSYKTTYINCQLLNAEKEFEILKSSHPNQVYFNYGEVL